MSTLQRIVIADPASLRASEIARKCSRLGETIETYVTGGEAVEAVEKGPVDLLILSLEIRDGSAEEVLAAVSGKVEMIFGTYRELSARDMKRYSKAGISEFVAQPVDTIEVFRAASEHFRRPFRQHERHRVELPIHRVDGEPVGTTRDLSEGGMLVAVNRDVSVGSSQLWTLPLPGAEPLRVRCSVLGADLSEGKQTAVKIRFERLLGSELTRLAGFLAELDSS